MLVWIAVAVVATCVEVAIFSMLAVGADADRAAGSAPPYRRT